MNIMIDLIFFIAALTVIFLMVQKNTAVATSHFVALVIAVGAGLGIAAWLTQPLADAASSRNPYTGAALTDLAEVAEVRRLDSDPLTLAQIDLPALKTQKADELDQMLNRYGTSLAEIDASGTADSAAFVAEIASPIWRATVRAVLFVVSGCIIFWILSSCFRTLLYRKFSKNRKHKKMAILLVLALLSAVVVCSYGLVPIFKWFSPFAFGILKKSPLASSCDQSVLYGIFEMLYLL